MTDGSGGSYIVVLPALTARIGIRRGCSRSRSSSGSSRRGRSSGGSSSSSTTGGSALAFTIALCIGHSCSGGGRCGGSSTGRRIGCSGLKKMSVKPTVGRRRAHSGSTLSSPGSRTSGGSSPLTALASLTTLPSLLSTLAGLLARLRPGSLTRLTTLTFASLTSLTGLATLTPSTSSLGSGAALEPLEARSGSFTLHGIALVRHHMT